MIITIDNLPVELRITHYLPPEPPRGIYGPGSTAEVEWLHEMADHFNLWAQIDRLVLEAIADSHKKGGAL